MASKPPDAFLSYTHFDDRRDRGRITQFRQELADEVRAVTGEPFEIFQDVDGIGIGEHWPDKLDQMLDEVRFFIPILTPSYFTSKACRDELQKFMRAENTARRNDLILPIYWRTCRVIEQEEVRASDLLAKMIHQRQRRDWRQLREHTFRTRKVRLAMQEIATAIEEARERIQPKGPTDFQPPQHWRLESLPGQPSPTPAATQWSRVREELREEFDETAFRTWLAPITLMGVEGERVLLGVPTHFLRDWVAAHYADRIRTLWQRIDPTISGVALTVAPQEGNPDTALLRSKERAPPEPGTVFRDVKAPWCPELVVIPPGEFMMGSTEVEKERPQHQAQIAYPLAVGRYPATFEEYDHFAGATRRELPCDEGWGRGRRPAINVSWDDAMAYVEWLSGATGQPYRLLSEAEWEHACRAGTATRYCWGDDISPLNANYGKSLRKTTEVGSYPANAFGLYDMQGNVWEWVEDRWHENYEGAPHDGSTWTEGSDPRRVVRGGSWGNSQKVLRSTARVRYDTDERRSAVGFRVARTL